jgi:hypothetical protein
MFNPFFYGNPVSPDQFINRRRELRRIISRIANQGQSIAVVGEPCSGKTSLLVYLSAPETRAKCYGSDGERLLFSYLDAQTLGGEFSQAQFWEYGLRPLFDRVIIPNPNTPLAQAYRTCVENGFGTFVLERLLAQVGPTGWRLVLMLDEFDVLLHHPILNSAEFFGSLRSLISRSRGALALVIASRRSLANLNEATQQFSHTGSPYFNFLSEITLGPLPNHAVAELLRRAGDTFTADDCRRIIEVAGGHPYLLQVSASALWEVYTEDSGDPDRQWQRVGQKLYGDAARILGDIWRLWSPETRRAFTAVALTQMNVLGQSKLHVKRLLRGLRGLEQELQLLEKQGFLVKDENVPGGWQVRPRVFLWWLADDLARTVRQETPFEEWLQKQELEVLLTRDEKERWRKAIRAVGTMLRDGAMTLIEAAARGAVGAMVESR